MRLLFTGRATARLLLPSLLLLFFLGHGAGPAARLAAASPKVPAGLQEKINGAVEDGVAWLLDKQLKDGSWAGASNPTYGNLGESQPEYIQFGVTALSVLALLESNVSPKHDAVKRGMDYLLANADKALYSYDMGTFLIMAHSYYRHLELERRKENPAERWEDDKKTKYSVRDEIAEVIKKFVVTLNKLQLGDGGWRYVPGVVGVADEREPDPSSTQFALLGLHSADALGFESPARVYQKAAECLLDMQEEDGAPVDRGDPEQIATDGDSYVPIAKDRARGWPYIKKSKDQNSTRVTGSMTTVGVCGLIIAKSHLNDGRSLFYKRRKEDINQAIYDGFAWLTKNWTVQGNPQGWRSHYYYLYGLERVGMLGGFDYIGTKNWYREGAEFLVAAQHEDGHWDDMSEINPKDMMGTCFALLFLKRGTVPVVSGRPERE